MLRHNTRLLSTTAAGAAATHSSSSRGDDDFSSNFAPQRAEAVPPLPVHLKPSSSASRKPSFYFPRMREEVPPSYAFQPTRLGAALPLFNITSSSCEYYALRLPLLKAGFRRVPEGYADIASNLIWGRSMPFREMLKSTLANTADGALTRALHFPQPSSRELAVYLDKLTMVNKFQRFNHYPLSHANLGCKRGMAINVRNAQRQAEAAATSAGEREAARERYGFMPRTWFYPQEKESLVAAMKASASGSHFIWKPARGSCGRGILISDGGARHAASWESVMRQIDTKAACKESGRLFRNYVVQEYIENPFLVEGRKMDLRLYVAVTSFNPLTVYWHEEGLVRLAAEAYNGTSTTGTTLELQDGPLQEGDNDANVSSTISGAASTHLRDRFRHLTNYSVGRKYTALQEALTGEDLSEHDGAPSAAAGPELKWPLQRLWDYVDATVADPLTQTVRHPSDAVRENIAQLITRTLMAVRPVIDGAVARVPMPGHYFELYGFDVMLDAQLRPFLIEVNTLPSLESSSAFDYATKTNVIADLLNVAMLEPFERPVLPGTSLWNSAMVRDEAQVPLAAAEKALVHSCAETVSSSTTSGATEKGVALTEEDVQLRLRDELAYARGFQRIFPAKPVSSLSPCSTESGGGVSLPFSFARQPLDSLGRSADYRDDVRFYSRTKAFTQKDNWAHES